MRRSSCSTLKPAMAPLRLLQSGGTVEGPRQVVDRCRPSYRGQQRACLCLRAAESRTRHRGALEIDVGELQLGFEVGARPAIWRCPSSPSDTAESLRFADGHGETAVAQAGGHSGASELGSSVMRAADRRKSMSKPVRPSSGMGVRLQLRCPPPATRPSRRRARHRSLPRQGCPAAAAGRRRQGQDALGRIAVELDIDAGEGDGVADDVGLRLERETAETSARQRLQAGPSQGVAQRRAVGRQRSFDLQGRVVAQMPVERELERHPAIRSLKPDRSPRRAAEKVAKLRLASIFSSRQAKCPVAPKLLEIDGQASDNSTIAASRRSRPHHAG